MKHRLLVLIIILLHLFPLSAIAGSGEIVIEVRESVNVNSRKVTLGEIADIEAPAIIKRQLAAIDMGFAPAPGKSKIINGRQLESKIRSNRLFLENRVSPNKNSSDKKTSINSSGNNSSENITIIVPDKIYIERSSQEVSENDLKAIYEDYVSEKLDGQDFEINDFSVRGLEVYPEGEVSISTPTSNDKEIKGRVTLYVKVKVDGKDYGRLSLSGWIDIFDNVLCAARSLTRGKVLELGDVNVQRVNVANINGDYFNDPNDVVGRVLTKNAPNNKAIVTNMIEDAALVRKGDSVKIIAARGNLKIITIGTVKSDGKMDDTVQVQNMTSGKVINAIVTGKESVKVFY
ncbi:MAG: flagellar basal body P-ring formation protein FlgA [Desulfamplus sp.]|nr:flagellar basal body P-ring formation protein FlgA [Desulfamplus sp.]